MERFQLSSKTLATLVFSTAILFTSKVASCEYNSVSQEPFPSFNSKIELEELNLSGQNPANSNTECFKSITDQQSNYNSALKSFSLFDQPTAFEFKLNASEVENLTVSDKLKELIQLSNELAIASGNNTLSQKKNIARVNLDKII